MSQICGHIQTPAVCVIGRGNPLPSNIKNIIHQLSGTFVIQFRQRIVSPPAVISSVVGPLITVIKMKIILIRTVSRNIGSFFVSGSVFIDPSPVHPLIKRTAMIKNAVQNHFDPASMRLLHQFCKKGITGVKVFPVRYPVDVSCRLTVFRSAVLQQFSPIVYDLSQMGINIIIILYIIFMIRRRNKKRIKINHVYSQIFQIVQFIHYPLQISAVKTAHIHLLRIGIPVLHMYAVAADILILVCQNVV